MNLDGRRYAHTLQALAIDPDIFDCEQQQAASDEECGGGQDRTLCPGADALEIDRWAETPVTFTNSRWLKPIDRFREELYLYSPKGAQYTADGLRARWGRWLADTPEGREICRRWKDWIAAQVKKYDWDIEPDDADHPTIHGLRGTGILARAEQGYEVDQIANDIGMSRQNVEHYMRFKDQMQVAAQGQKRLRLVSNED